MEPLAIAGLALRILAKEAGVPLPIPGDIVIIGAGATLAGDLFGAGAVLAIILAAGFIGASVQFLLFGSALRRPALAALERLGVGEARIRGLSDRLRGTGARGVAIARMTPGVRIAFIPAALAALPFLVFLPGRLVAGNGVFVTAHFGLVRPGRIRQRAHPTGEWPAHRRRGRRRTGGGWLGRPSDAGHPNARDGHVRMLGRLFLPGVRVITARSGTADAG